MYACHTQSNMPGMELDEMVPIMMASDVLSMERSIEFCINYISVNLPQLLASMTCLPFLHLLKQSHRLALLIIKSIQLKVLLDQGDEISRKNRQFAANIYKAAIKLKFCGRIEKRSL